MHTCMYTHTPAHTHIHSHTHTHTCTYTHTHTHTHTCIHTYTHIHTHTHIHRERERESHTQNKTNKQTKTYINIFGVIVWNMMSVRPFFTRDRQLCQNTACCCACRVHQHCTNIRSYCQILCAFSQYLQWSLVTSNQADYDCYYCCYQE